MRLQLPSWWYSLRQLTKDRERTTDLLSTGFLQISSVLTYMYGVSSVLPEALINHPKTLIVLRVVSTWIFVCIISNFYLVHKRNPSIHVGKFSLEDPNNDLLEEKVDEQSKAGEVWHKCDKCQVIVPPRTWHCRICNICIVRRDHHCTYTGCCIGEKNQSNFVSLLFYISVGTTIFAVLTFYNHVFLKEVPILDFMIRLYFETYMFVFDYDVVLLMSAINLFGQFAAWGMFGFYLYNSLRGQTSADYHRGIRRNSPGCWSLSYGNMRKFLGATPIWNILWPFHSSGKVEDSTNDTNLDKCF